MTLSIKFQENPPYKRYKKLFLIAEHMYQDEHLPYKLLIVILVEFFINKYLFLYTNFIFLYFYIFLFYNLPNTTPHYPQYKTFNFTHSRSLGATRCLILQNANLKKILIIIIIIIIHIYTGYAFSVQVK